MKKNDLHINTTSKRFIICTIILCVFSISLNAQSINHHIFRLDNGLEVVLVPSYAVNMVSANFVVNVGARDECWATWGSAHFLEHMLFNGTETRTQEEIYHAFDNIGAYKNAHTGSHFTNYMLLSSAINFPIAFEVFSDMVFNSTLPEDNFEKERGIIIEEIRMTQTRYKDTDRPFREMLFGDSPLARNVLGTVESITRLEREDVLEFYKEWYVPNNMLLYVSGYFSPDTMQIWLNEQLSNVRPVDLPERMVLDKPKYDLLSANPIHYRIEEVDSPVLMLAYDAPLVHSVDFIPFFALSKILEKRLSAKMPSGVSGSVYITVDPNLSVLRITISGFADDTSMPEREKELLNSVKDVIQELTKKRVSDDEITDISLRWRADEVFNSERLHHYGIVYSTWWALSGFADFATWGKRLSQLTPQMIQKTAQLWFADAKGVQMVLLPYEGSAAPSNSVDSVDLAEKHHNVSKHKTKDGMTIVIKEDPLSRVFALHILVKDRYLWDNKYYGTGTADVLHRVIIEDDPASKNRIADQIDQIAAIMKTHDDPRIPFDDYYTVPDYSFIRFECLPDYWNEGVRIVSDMMSRIPRSEEAFASSMESYNRAKGQQSRSPVRVGRRALVNTLFPNSALSASVYGDVDVDRTQLEAFRKQYFHPSNLIVSVSSSLNSQEVSDLIEKEFKRISDVSLSPIVRDDDEVSEADGLSPIEDNEIIIKLGHRQGALLMGARIPNIDPADRADLVIANAYLNERVGFVLREERGLAYSLGSSLSLLPSDDDGLCAYWELSIGTSPANIPLAKEGMEEVITEFEQKVFSDEEVTRLSNAISGRAMMRDMSAIGQAYSMGVGEFYWEDPNHRVRILDEINSVTSDNVANVVNKYLTEVQFLIVKVE